jgi:3-oxoacyl-[acyl-carrier protein] reductase
MKPSGKALTHAQADLKNAPGMKPVAVVTGGTRGIGYETAVYLASLGWSVALCSRDQDEALTAARRIGSTYPVETFGAGADVSDPSQVRQFAEQVVERLGQVKVLVCNAAVLGPVGRIKDVSPDAIASSFAVNVYGFSNCVTFFWPSLEKASPFRIIALAGGGLGGPNQMKRAPAYVPSKSALVSMVELISDEVVSAGGTANVIAPGDIPTNFMKTVIDAGPIAAGDLLYSQALQREGKDIGSAHQRFLELLVFLLSEQSSKISGRFLSARWNDPVSLYERSRLDLSESLFRLRRIDDDLFIEAPK